MIRFNPDFLENFLGVVRKYMQIRGNLTQRDVSEQTGIGISTMSRFLNLKTTSIDERVVANLIATLKIPLHEIIDGVEEESTETLKKLVQLYKEDAGEKDSSQFDENLSSQESGYQGHQDSEKTRLKTKASIHIGGKSQEVPFGEKNLQERARPELSLREKLETLSPRQKTYLNDFLNLDIHDRDLIVDLGDAIFKYFRARNLEF